jgi:diacylglycerol kinase
MVAMSFSFVESGFVVVAITLVLGSEILNTILEDTANELEPNHHSFIGKIKDMMAAVVLINSLAALVIGALVFYHHFVLSV